MQGLKKHKHYFSSFIQSNMDLRKPRQLYSSGTRTGSYRVLLVFPEHALNPTGLACSGAVMRAQLPCCQPSLALAALVC